MLPYEIERLIMSCCARIVPLLALALAACGSVQPKPLVSGPTTASPQSVLRLQPTPGSLYQPGQYRSFFRDDIPSRIGDSLTVVIQERASSSLSAESKGSRRTDIENGLSADLDTPFVNHMFGWSSGKKSLSGKLGASGGETVDGRGSRSNNSSFTSSISVTVVDVLANGYLRVSGEKQVQINDDNEQIRLSGTVNPRDIQPGSLVSSTKLTDVRLEQQATGNQRLFTTPGWLTRFFMSVLPF
ncbi:flagellar basal body L-ring protein FlgH [Aquitalea aquatica]|uniref:Flagellar basal body L-ring protein FlgH n=1 Tax=Aquitalea aquatica TaxID=3044273 RepID=A0A838Y3B4_9NEIS|nr:flagellar basal body L-ring protein FlgH [Aquitalea magnusonii]MBA4707109.1 flagellar basal body L-ring protein FlgH [Aquitalea magnusonii]